MMLMGVSLATILVPLQALIGDAHGINTLEHQPVKLAAIEGIWDTQKGVPAVVFAIPDEKTESNKLEIGIPKLASLYLTHSLDGEVKGLKSVPREDRPPVVPVFFGFRIMVGMWAIMLLITAGSWVLILRKRLYETTWFLRFCSYAIPGAMSDGWCAMPRPPLLWMRMLPAVAPFTKRSFVPSWTFTAPTASAG